MKKEDRNIYCNRCGIDCRITSGLMEGASLDHCNTQFATIWGYWSYGSVRDGDFTGAHICDACFEELEKFMKEKEGFGIEHDDYFNRDWLRPAPGQSMKQYRPEYWEAKQVEIQHIDWDENYEQWKSLHEALKTNEEKDKVPPPRHMRDILNDLKELPEGKEVVGQFWSVLHNLGLDYTLQDPHKSKGHFRRKEDSPPPEAPLTGLS